MKIALLPNAPNELPPHPTPFPPGINTFPPPTADHARDPMRSVVMASQSKSDAARQNGSQSRGPATPEGKARSSQNARKHGLCASFATVPGEDQPAFDALLASVEESYQPAGPLECELARTLATLRWRLRRIPEIETAILTNELALAKPQIDLAFSEINDAERLGFVFQKLADSGKSLALLLRYETSLTRLYDRTLKQLAKLQKLRNEPNQPPAPNPDSYGGDPSGLRNEPSTALASHQYRSPPSLPAGKRGRKRSTQNRK